MKTTKTASRSACRQQPRLRGVFAGLAGVMLILLLATGVSTAAQEFPSYADLANQVKYPVVNIFTTKVIEMGQGTLFGQQGSPFEDFFKHFISPQRSLSTQRSFKFFTRRSLRAPR